MTGLELVVAIGLVVVLGSIVADRLRIAAPVALLLLGVGLAFIPDFAGMELPSEVVLFLFLPIILFWEALTSSLRSLRTFHRGVFLTSTVLVALTASAVAWVANLVGVPWETAWVLGAALAPSDATVVAAMAKLLPRRSLTMLRAESLLNDGTALVIFAVALGIAQHTSEASAGTIALDFGIAVGGGVLAGVVVGWLGRQLQRRLGDELQHNAVLLLVPLAAYLLAELVHASGVLAVVAAGLYLARVAPRESDARHRHPAVGFWRISTFLLNGAIFALVGMQLPGLISELRSVGLLQAAVLAAIVLATIFLVRLLFLIASAYTIRLVDRRPEQRQLQMSNRARVVSAVCGFRGGISLAMALSVPAGVAGRDAIVVVTAFVVLGTIVVQGLALPAVVRWARLPRDERIDEEARVAEVTAAEAVVASLPRLVDEAGLDEDVAERIRAEYSGQLAAAQGMQDGDDAMRASAGRYARLRLAIVEVKRRTFVRLRDEGRIDDEVLLDVQERLDMEQLRWERDPARDGIAGSPTSREA